MERNVKDLLSRQNLVFAKSPFERIFHSKLKTPKIENNLVIEPPTKAFVSQSNSELIFPKSDLSKLRIDPPSERIEFIKTTENKIDTSTLPTSEKFIPKIIEIPKEDWEKRDFIKLENWHLIRHINSNDISIIGYRSDIEELWLSDAVLARINETRIITKSKACYQLVGVINSFEQESNIISLKFGTGFPEDWKEIIQKSKY